MMTVSDIFSVLGGSSAVARALGVKPSTASEMKRRGSIPAEHWRALLIAARRRGLSELDAETLVRLHARSTAGAEPALSGPEPAAEQRMSGHFSRHFHISKPHFSTASEIAEHVAALRDEWDGR